MTSYYIIAALLAGLLGVIAGFWAFFFGLLILFVLIIGHEASKETN